MNPDDDISWVDPGIDGFEIVVAEFLKSSGEMAVLIRGDSSLTRGQTGRLKELGFRRVDGPRTVWARRGGAFRFSEMKEVFPKARRVLKNPSEVRVDVRGASPFVDVAEPLLEHPPHRHDDRKPNAYQDVYHPASRVGTPIAMIPINMAGPTSAALSRIEHQHGQIDEFLANKLGYDLEKLAAVLSPEQVDAAAMGFAAALRGREMILADQTGLGKGRVLASLMLAAARAGKTVVFITEKANLFSDIFRDLMDIDAVDALGKPFLMNSDSKVIDVTSVNGDILHDALPDKELRKAIKACKLPDGCRFVMLTHSQLNRLGSAKETFLKAVAKDAYVVVDEAHNAAGADSNTSESLEVALSEAWGVIRSSATFARDAEALLKYPRVLPPGLASEDVRIALQAGGNEIAEAIAQYLAEDGVLIRREHDLSGIKIDVVVDEARRELNMEYSDALAPILAKMAGLQRMVDDEIDNRNEEAERVGGKAGREIWYSANFGSRRAPLLRQFLTALSVEFCIDRCVDSLMAGEKPVVVIEQTMESLMRELAGTRGGDQDDLAVESVEGAGNEAEIEALEGTRPPDFKDALMATVDRIMQMSVRKGKEDPEKVPVEDPYVVAEAENLRALIAQFPDLSLSPIDDIRNRIESISKMLLEDGEIDRVWTADEISARNLRVIDGVYTPIQKRDRNETIVGFNSGMVDALVITRAASTGLSLHASERAKDQRPRRMIELQIPANVVERIQFWGRVNRRGQVNIPSFETLSTGLPSQMRILAMNNRKVERLSATVSANASTATTMDVPDMLDSVGNDVAMRILTDQPAIAEKMFIAMRNIDKETAEQELYYINKFLQGFVYLTSKEGEELFDLLLKEYDDAVMTLKSRGESPRGTKELQGRWREVSREPYEDGSPADGPVFGRAVDLVVMEGEIEKDALSGSRIRKAVAEARKRLGEDSGSPTAPFFMHHVREIEKNRKRILKSALSGRYISVDQALKDRDPNAVKAADARLRGLCEILSDIEPGLGISIPDDEGNLTNGVVVDVRLRNPDLPHQPSEWSVRYACPGDTSVSEISAATLMRDQRYKLFHARPRDTFESSVRQFDEAPTGIVTERRQFLDGNLVRAMLIATEISAGSMVTYTDEGGLRHRSVMVHKRGHKALRDRISTLRNTAEAMKFLSNGQSVFTDYRDRNAGINVRVDANGLSVSRPRGKDWDRFMEAGPGRLVGSFRADRGNVLVARVADNKVEAFLEAVFASGLPLYYDNRTIQAKQNRFAGGQQQRRSGEGFGPKQQNAPSFGGPKF